ncbi:MAG: hypothetical protein HYX67_07865 [Candidatus Melainabacteria bacterium]|nr:hypothetical protein [Candidatus Melainabacteria bacterium]
MTKIRDRLWTAVNIAFLVALLVPATWISAAYAIPLTAMGAPVPGGAFQIIKAGKLGSIVKVSTIPTPKNGFKSVQSDSHLVINSETWMNRWLSTVMANRKNLLWSSYPASIRGQVFSSSEAGGDPLATGGW